MTGNLLWTLIAAGLWLYGLYLALTRTKSATAKAVALAALVGLFLGSGGIELAATPASGRDYPYQTESTRRLPKIARLEVSLTNAELVIQSGEGTLRLASRAKTAAALARMRPEVRIEGDRLVLRDDRQPSGTLYVVRLALPQPVEAKLGFTNGELRAEDTLRGLSLSATNGTAKLKDDRPSGPTRINMTNGEVVLEDFAPSGETRIELINGDVRVRANKPLRVEARVTNGKVRLPSGVKKASAGGLNVTYGPNQAPRLVVRMLNGTLDYQEVNP